MDFWFCPPTFSIIWSLASPLSDSWQMPWYRNLAQEANNILFIDPTNNCPAICPAPCPAAQRCPGTSNDGGCPMPDTCMPITFGENGKACPVACPVTCPASQKVCEGGFDAYGCRLPNTCIPDHGNFLTTSYYLLNNHTEGVHRYPVHLNKFLSKSNNCKGICRSCWTSLALWDIKV